MTTTTPDANTSRTTGIRSVGPSDQGRDQEMRLCIECKHCVWDAAKPAEFSLCMRPGTKKTDPVDGHTSFWYCSTVRESKLAIDCGMEAKFYEAKR